MYKEKKRGSVNENTRNPIVSVCVQTYQHAPFIRQTLDSILMQKTDFPFEIVLGEDESIDGTREICIEYANKHPDIIRLFLNSRKNVIYVNGFPTGRWNFINNLRNARGKYIALMPGDDYWIGPDKLQQQVNFLEANPDYAMCFHNAYIVEENALTVKKVLTDLKKEEFTTEDTLNPFGVFAPTSSLVFKNHLITYMPPWTYDFAFGDRLIFTMLSKHGRIKYIDFTGSVRRMHPGGVTNFFNQKSICLNRIIFFKNIPQNIGNKYRKICMAYHKYFYQRLIMLCLLNIDYECNDKLNLSIKEISKKLFNWDFISLLRVKKLGPPIEDIVELRKDRSFYKKIFHCTLKILKIKCMRYYLLVLKLIKSVNNH